MEADQKIANATAKAVHTAICQTGTDMTVRNADGSISAEETLGLIHGAMWGIAAFVSQSVVVHTTGEGADKMSAEEAMSNQLAEQFVYAYRAYRDAAKATAN
jgi:hypothetical protein